MMCWKGRGVGLGGCQVRTAWPAALVVYVTVHILNGVI